MFSNSGAGEDSWVPWTARRSNQLTIKDINPEYSLEGLMLKSKLQYVGHLMWRDNSWPWVGKRPWCWERLKALEECGNREDEMVGWHHWLSGHEFEQTPGDSEGQESLACCSPWGCKESDTTFDDNKNEMWDPGLDPGIGKASKQICDNWRNPNIVYISVNNDIPNLCPGASPVAKS